jgi:mRNA interferase RelE/StbE
VSEADWRVDLAPAAQRQLRKLPPNETARLRGPILALGRDPRPPGAGQLAGTAFWRLRVGDVRLTYAIDDHLHRIVIFRVARRNESTYRRIG